MNVNIQSVNKIQSWARGQITKAAGYIRQVSRDFGSFDEEEDSASRVRERRAIIQSSDEHFFEQLSGEEDAALVGILPDKYANKTAEAEGQADVDKASDNKLAERFSQFSLNPPRQRAEEQQKHTNDLYLETLYTILHKIGRESGSSEEQLIRYAKAAFQVEERTHQMLMERARREKPPILLLNVLLLEARELIAKDIDGFSDPFVMLGIIPSTRRKSRGPPEEEQKTEMAAQQQQEHQSAEAAESGGTEGNRHHHKNVLQRFSGSFRRKAGTRREKMEAAFEMEDEIPARIIKASSVQRKTLNPKWNEKFQFVVGDVTDRFHLDIWDHDDENRSVIDVVTSLNQVQGLKGLGRYFKEVTQSARSSSGDLVDDFLGSVTFPLREIPSAGIEQWFRLEKRSEKSEVSGQILLKLWLSTREEHRLSSTEDHRNEDFIFLEDEGLVDVQQHKDLVRKFGLYEISRRAEPVCAYRGQLPEQALLILHQHAIQSDLAELHQLMCQWLAYLQMLGMAISFELLHDTFARLVAKWKPMELDKDEECVLADSMLQFCEFCRAAILKHRLRIRTRGGSSRRRSPSPKRSELESFGEMLRCFRLVRESPVFGHLVPYQKLFLAEMRELLAESARVHFEVLLANIDARAQADWGAVLELNLLLRALNATMDGAGKFEAAFRKEMPELDYADIAYGTFDSLLHEHIVGEMMSEQRGGLRAIMQVCHAQQQQGAGAEGDRQLLAILQVHLAMNQFAGYRIGARRQHYKMEQLNWAEHFDRAIQRWLELALVRAFARVDLSLGLDAQGPVVVLNNDVRKTISAMDTCHIIEQLLFVWERLKVQNVLLRAELTLRLARLLCKVGKHFADQIMMRRPFDGARPEQLSAEQIDQFAAMANSCEQVRRSLDCGERLRLEELGKLYEQKTKEKSFRAKVEQQLDLCGQNIAEQIDLLIVLGQFVRRQTGQYKKAIFHLVWSPLACPTDECLKPLIKLLDAELSLVHRCLLHRNFTRVMYAQVQLLLKLFQECADENIGQEPSFYRRLTDALAILLDFFHAEGKGISVESFSQSADYRRFHEQISLYQMPTEKLIELYYGELLKAQDEVTECKYGILNVRAYFNPNSELLVVDVLSAKQLIPLDSNGLSDPYVVIELLPRIYFPDQPRANKTKVVSMCLNPVFSETFEFHVPPYLPSCALVHFVIMDHDFLKSNDFAGEAFLDLNEVPGFASLQGAVGGLKQFNLVLTHPSSRVTNPTIMTVLASRKEDKEAEEFMRSLSATY